MTLFRKETHCHTVELSPRAWGKLYFFNAECYNLWPAKSANQESTALWPKRAQSRRCSLMHLAGCISVDATFFLQTRPAPASQGFRAGRPNLEIQVLEVPALRTSDLVLPCSTSFYGKIVLPAAWQADDDSSFSPTRSLCPLVSLLGIPWWKSRPTWGVKMVRMVKP